MKKTTLFTAIACSLLFSFSSAWALSVSPFSGGKPDYNFKGKRVYMQAEWNKSQNKGSGITNNSPVIQNVKVDNPTVDTPEPATMLLLGTGLVGLAAFGRKKIKARS